MKTITYNDEVAPWNRSNHLMGTRSLLTMMTSSLEPLWEPLDWVNGKPEHTCDWDCLTVHTSVSLLPVLCLLKPIAHVCTLKMAEDEVILPLPLPMACLQPCNKTFSVTMSLYLAYRRVDRPGTWPGVQNSHRVCVHGHFLWVISQGEWDIPVSRDRWSKETLVQKTSGSCMSQTENWTRHRLQSHSRVLLTVQAKKRKIRALQKKEGWILARWDGGIDLCSKGNWKVLRAGYNGSHL
jgi:hypothetical protein